MKRFALDEFGRDDFGHDQFTPLCARGCHLGGGSSGNSSIDPNILNIIQSNYARAGGIANQPFQPYTGQLVAPLNTAQNTAGSVLEGVPNGQGQQWMSQGANVAGAASNPNSILGQIQNYQNPYTQQVANTTMQQLGQYNQNQLANNASDATKSGAFGGDRLGVQDALTNQAYGQIAASTLANLNSQGFNTALGAAQQGNAQQLQGAGILGSLGNQNVYDTIAAGQGILGYGNQAQQTAQAQLTAPYQQYLAAQQWPISMQNLLTSSYMGGGAANTANPNASGNFMQGVGGLASGGAGLLGGVAQNTNVFPWLGGLFGSGAAAAGAATGADLSGLGALGIALA